MSDGISAINEHQREERRRATEEGLVDDSTDMSRELTGLESFQKERELFLQLGDEMLELHSVTDVVEGFSQALYEIAAGELWTHFQEPVTKGPSDPFPVHVDVDGAGEPDVVSMIADDVCAIWTASVDFEGAFQNRALLGLIAALRDLTTGLAGLPSEEVTHQDTEEGPGETVVLSSLDIV